MKSSKFSLFLIAVLGVSLIGCGNKPGSDVVVNVNGKPVTVSEINLKAGVSATEKNLPISPVMMKSLIEAELIRQAAADQKLDQDEAVRAKIANATQSILISAYMEKTLAAIAKPTDADNRAYFDQHPERFAGRKQYDTREIFIPLKPGVADKVKAQLGTVKGADEFVAWLKTNQILHHDKPVSLPSDQILPEIMDKLKNLAVGGHAVLENSTQMSIIFVTALTSQPVTFEQVAGQLSEIVLNDRRQTAINTAVKQLRDKAKVEYVKPYSENGFTPAAAKP